MNELKPLQPSKCADYFKDFLPDITERRKYLRMLQGSALPERYAHNYLSIVLRLVPDRDIELTAERRTELPDRCLSHPPHLILELHALDIGDAEGRDESGVLVVDVEIVQGQKFGVPSTAVWLDVPGKEFKERSAGIYFSTNERSFKMRGIVEDREFVIAGFDAIGEASLEDGQPCNVKRGAKTMNGISENKHEIAPNSAVAGFVVKDLLPGLRVECLSGEVRVTCLSDAPLKIDDVLIGPLNF